MTPVRTASSPGLRTLLQFTVTLLCCTAVQIDDEFIPWRENQLKKPHPNSRNMTGPLRSGSHVLRMSRAAAHRPRRLKPLPTYTLDVAAVVDYSVYELYLDDISGGTSKPRKDDAVRQIKEHMVFIFKQVNDMYKSSALDFNLHVKLVKVIVWHDRNKNNKEVFNGSPPFEVTKILKKLISYTQSTKGKTALNEADHTMLFTAYKLIRENGAVAGLAPSKKMCSSDESASVIRYTTRLQQVPITVVHELSHSIGATHDGPPINSECPGSDLFIMQVGDITNKNYKTSGSDKSKQKNAWKFSTCSIEAISKWVKQGATSEISDCLKKPKKASVDIKSITTDLAGKLLGQEINATQQCRRYNKTFVCHNVTGVEPFSCLTMSCGTKTSRGGISCQKYTPAEGTSCANRKVCQRGECVTHPNAPAYDEKCPFGENIFYEIRGHSCASLTFGGYCYIPEVEAQCCKKCPQFLGPAVPAGTQAQTSAPYECRYGDEIEDCSTTDCETEEAKLCCETCGPFEKPNGSGSVITKSPTHQTAVFIAVAFTATALSPLI